MPFFRHSSVDERLGCFHVSAVVNNASMNMSVQLSLQILISILLDKIAKIGIAVLYDNSVFKIFGEPPYCFSYWLRHFTFPPTVNNGTNFSTSLPILVIFRIFCCCFVFLVMAILTVVKWYLIVFFVCISQWWKMESFLSKVRNKTRIPTLGSRSQSS